MTHEESGSEPEALDRGGRLVLDALLGCHQVGACARQARSSLDELCRSTDHPKVDVRERHQLARGCTAECRTGERDVEGDSPRCPLGHTDRSDRLHRPELLCDIDHGRLEHSVRRSAHHEHAIGVGIASVEDELADQVVECLVHRRQPHGSRAVLVNDDSHDAEQHSAQPDQDDRKGILREDPEKPGDESDGGSQCSEEVHHAQRGTKPVGLVLVVHEFLVCVFEVHHDIPFVCAPQGCGVGEQLGGA